MSKNNFSLLVLLGPTATGKTKLSIDLARSVKAEIISADSMQIYREMDIGTAKASPEIRRIIPHHMIDIISPDKKFSVADFQKAVDHIIPLIEKKGHLPMLVGGTGLYIKAVIEGFLLPGMEKDFQLRDTLKELASEKGRQAVHSKLATVDPELAKKLHPNDLRRVIRGIEIYKQTGKSKSYFIKKQKDRAPRYQNIKIGLKRPRQQLYQRINQRVEQMIENGLVEEVKKLRAEYDLSITSLQALGYREINDYLEGKYSLEEAVRLIKRNTRHFAKRQITWFKRDNEINWFNLAELSHSEVLQKIKNLITAKK